MKKNNLKKNKKACPAKLKRSRGFTIIEMMVAISIFLVVVIYGMSALLNVNAIHKKTQNMRSVMDTLTFTLDDMSKNIRVGSKYSCITDETGFSNINTNVDGENCIGIAFTSSDANAPYKWTYFIEGNKVWKSTYDINNENYGDAIQLTPNDVEIDMANSNFTIIGSDPADTLQPLVNIRLTGKIKDTSFSIQTAVSERLIDVGGQ